MEISESFEAMETGGSESIREGNEGLENVTEGMEVDEEVSAEGVGLGAEGGQHPEVVSELGAVSVHEVAGGEEGLLTDCMPGLTRPEVISVLRTVAEADPEEARELFAAAGLSLTFCSESPS